MFCLFCFLPFNSNSQTQEGWQVSLHNKFNPVHVTKHKIIIPKTFSSHDLNFKLAESNHSDTQTPNAYNYTLWNSTLWTLNSNLKPSFQLCMGSFNLQNWVKVFVKSNHVSLIPRAYTVDRENWPLQGALTVCGIHMCACTRVCMCVCAHVYRHSYSNQMQKKKPYKTRKNNQSSNLHRRKHVIPHLRPGRSFLN